MTLTRRVALKLTLAQATLGVTARAAHPGPRDDDRMPNTFDVVFEGGGIKGASFCGALKVLEEAKVTFRHLVGTSAGAITAALLAAGYRWDQLLKILTARDAENPHVFNTFLQPPSPPPVPTVQFKATGHTIHDKLAKQAAEKFPALWRGFAKTALGASEAFAPIAVFQPKFRPERIRGHIGQGLALLSVGAAASDKPFLDWLTQQLTKGPDHLPADVTLEAFHRRPSREASSSPLWQRT
jgi:hypothetical protein